MLYIPGARAVDELGLQPTAPIHVALALRGSMEYDAGNALWLFGAVAALDNMPVLAGHFNSCSLTGKAASMEEVHSQPFATPCHKLMPLTGPSPSKPTSCAGLPPARHCLSRVSHPLARGEVLAFPSRSRCWSIASC